MAGCAALRGIPPPPPLPPADAHAPMPPTTLPPHPQAVHGFGYGPDERNVPSLLRSKALVMAGCAALLEGGQGRGVWRAAQAASHHHHHSHHKGGHPGLQKAGGGSGRGTQRSSGAIGGGRKGGAGGEGGEGGGGGHGEGVTGQLTEPGAGAADRQRPGDTAGDGVTRASPAGNESPPVTGGGVLRPLQDNGVTNGVTPTPVGSEGAGGGKSSLGGVDGSGQRQRKGEGQEGEGDAMEVDGGEERGGGQGARFETDGGAAAANGDGGGGVRRSSSGAASAAAAAMGPAAGGGGGGDGGHQGVEFCVLPGEVVWVHNRGKGDPVWPALVITVEEADDFRRPRWGWGGVGG